MLAGYVNFLLDRVERGQRGSWRLTLGLAGISGSAANGHPAAVSRGALPMAGKPSAEPTRAKTIVGKAGRRKDLEKEDKKQVPSLSWFICVSAQTFKLKVEVSPVGLITGI